MAKNVKKTTTKRAEKPPAQPPYKGAALELAAALNVAWKKGDHIDRVTETTEAIAAYVFKVAVQVAEKSYAPVHVSVY